MAVMKIVIEVYERIIKIPHEAVHLDLVVSGGNGFKGGRKSLVWGNQQRTNHNAASICFKMQRKTAKLSGMYISHAEKKCNTKYRRIIEYQIFFQLKHKNV